MHRSQTAQTGRASMSVNLENMRQDVARHTTDARIFFKSIFSTREMFLMSNTE